MSDVDQEKLSIIMQSRIRTCGLRGKSLPRWLIPYLRNQLQWQSQLHLP